MQNWLTIWLCCLALSLGGCGRAPVSRSASETRVQPSAAAENLVESLNSATLVVPKAFGDQALIGPLADAYKRIDPKSDGWDSEAFGEAAVAQLKIVAGRFTGDASRQDLVTDSFAAPDIWDPNNLRETYQDDSLVVRRLAEPLIEPAKGSLGAERMQQLIARFGAEFSNHPHVKFKLYRVDAKESVVETMAYFHADGLSKAGRKEITSKWKITWQPSPAPRSAPRIQNIQVEELEIVEASNGGQPLFADGTAAIFAGDSAYQQQLLYSTDHWRARICRAYGLDVVANHGLAIGDVNGDMLEDLYVCQQGGLPNRLFIQQPDGTLKDASAGSGTDWLDFSASALLIDLDNDGDKDLAVGHEQNIVLMKNDGTGKFTIGHVLPSRAQTFSLAAADFDLDGDLDVFCCGYNLLAERLRTGAMGQPIPYHDAQNGGPNVLLLNNGNWEFTDATRQVGLEQNNNRFSFAASWEDYDNDGDPDLYVANDYGRNNLYRNDNGHFTDVANQLNVEDMSSGMSVSWADFNRDGWMDFYVSNMFSAAGNRITYQRQFKDTTPDEIKKIYQRHARGNSLFQADGEGGFRDVSESAGVTMGRWAWGSKFCDINNDGWQDIVVNNGFISTKDTGDL